MNWEKLPSPFLHPSPYHHHSNKISFTLSNRRERDIPSNSPGSNSSGFVTLSFSSRMVGKGYSQNLISAGRSNDLESNVALTEPNWVSGQCAGTMLLLVYTSPSIFRSTLRRAVNTRLVSSTVILKVKIIGAISWKRIC